MCFKINCNRSHSSTAAKINQIPRMEQKDSSVRCTSCYVMCVGFTFQFNIFTNKSQMFEQKFYSRGCCEVDISRYARSINVEHIFIAMVTKKKLCTFEIANSDLCAALNFCLDKQIEIKQRVIDSLIYCRLNLTVFKLQIFHFSLESFFNHHSHSSGFYWGQQFLWTLTSANSMQVSNIQSNDHNRK